MTEAVSTVFEKVSFVSKISTVLKATSDDEATIPGNLYTEISNITLESDGYSDSMLEYLVDRLNKNSCHVKLKVMKLMKHILSHGNPRFKLGLMKCSQGITETKKYSGPPDPLHGNIPYLAVRKTAKELLEVLFDTEDLPSSRAPVSTSSGYGNQGAPKSKMEGFGNSPSPQKVGIGKSFLQNISDFAQHLTEEPENPQRAVLSSLETPGSYKPPEDHTFSLAPDSSEGIQPSTRRKEVVHIPGKAGGGWDDDDDGDNENVNGNLSSDRHSGANADSFSRLESGNVEDWSTEENLVKSTVATGNSHLLTNAQIAEFIKSCQACNCDKVLELLSQSLESTDGHLLMRALLLVENFLRTDIYGIDQISTTCGKHLLTISERSSSPQTSKSRKIIRILEKLGSSPSIKDRESDLTT
ncbi:AP-4 complex accessory subunit Tepsin-like [Saccostrea echinata]|uniref:AP-4 complex accessory subunit Tepsin-like n=1 Tax=Saccostrea echinata TaxID=191078 RepID=UPI002A820CE9|nr:AP-4 complex accessory subunit Tepsin-like [Saccostrea echinata]